VWLNKFRALPRPSSGAQDRISSLWFLPLERGGSSVVGRGLADYDQQRFFLSCKANARVKPAKTGHGPQFSKILFVFYVLFVCKCVLFYSHRVATQLQLSYHIIFPEPAVA